jgi:hypothetical protein
MIRPHVGGDHLGRVGGGFAATHKAALTDDLLGHRVLLVSVRHYRATARIF